jgi:thioredoxin 1
LRRAALAARNSCNLFAPRGSNPYSAQQVGKKEEHVSTVKEIQEADFQNAVIESDLPVLVDFFAPWCGPCKALAPVLDGVAKTYESRLGVVKVNVDDAQQLAARYRIRGVPTLMFFKEGKVVDTVVGMPSGGALRTKLDGFAASPLRVGVCGCSA